jgi:hypothetical protein
MTYRNKLRVIVKIADIHIGARLITAEEFKYQLYERFIKPISELAILDVICIAGDLSDLPLSFNSKLSEVYLWFVDCVMKIAKDKNASVIIVEGTKSHDADQLNNIRFYEKDKDLELHICDKPTVIHTKGMRVYALPDIHVKDKKEEEELYNYPDKHFDFIVGHGSITETQFMKQESEHSISKNIVYVSKELVRMSKSGVYFGHIHGPLQFRRHIYYINSFLRFIHGEEAPKGYLISLYVPETGQYKTERVINDLAFNFNTYSMKHQDFERFDIEDIIKKINKFIDDYKVDRLRLDIQYLSTDPNVAKIHIIRNYYSKGKYAIIVNKMKLRSLSHKEAEMEQATSDKVVDEKKYLIDKSIKFEEKLQRFIKEEYQVDISLKKLEILLMSDELLSRDEPI